MQYLDKDAGDHTNRKELKSNGLATTNHHVLVAMNPLPLLQQACSGHRGLLDFTVHEGRTRAQQHVEQQHTVQMKCKLSSSRTSCCAPCIPVSSPYLKGCPSLVMFLEREAKQKQAIYPLLCSYLKSTSLP